MGIEVVTVGMVKTVASVPESVILFCHVNVLPDVPFKNAALHAAAKGEAPEVIKAYCADPLGG
jgi:hypothetical protein